MSIAVTNAVTLDELQVDTNDRTRSATAIKTAIRKLKARNGLTGARLPVVESSQFPHVSVPCGFFVFVLDYGNDTKGRYSVELKCG